MNENYMLEQIADALDNHFVDGDLVTVDNVYEHVITLMDENTTLSKEIEELKEDLEDMSENL